MEKTNTDGTFIIGNGSSSSSQNAFRVSFDGNVYGQNSYHSSGADYAETTEWIDGNPNNEDRVGKFVCIQGNKMRLANSKDVRNRLGVVSAKPAIDGDSYSENWKGKYKTDIFGRELTHMVHYEQILDDEGNIIIPSRDEIEFILSEDYNPNQEYVERGKRKEFGYFGMLGKLVVIDDATCEVDGYCYPNDNGIATKELDANKGFYVMERLDKNHIRILLK